MENKNYSYGLWPGPDDTICVKMLFGGGLVFCLPVSVSNLKEKTTDSAHSEAKEGEKEGQRTRPTLAYFRERAEYCFESTVSEERTH